MKTTYRSWLFTILLGSLVQAPCAWAVTVGQIDNFENGTTQNWIGGLGINGPNPLPPVNALGGPAGASDNYLRLTSDGGAGAGGRLSVLNLAQWSGNYIAAGVGFISMDLNNLGSTDLAIRLVFEDPQAGPPSNIAFSKNAFVLPAGSGWTHAVFPIGTADLQAGLGDVGTALMNTTAIRLYHSTAANFPNPIFPIVQVAAQLGVDNIQAERSVPDAGSTAMLWFPVLAAAAYFRRRTRHST